MHERRTIGRTQADFPKMPETVWNGSIVIQKVEGKYVKPKIQAITTNPVVDKIISDYIDNAIEELRKRGI